MRTCGIILMIGAAGVWAGAARAEVVTFLNDYEGFLEAAGDVQEIDFETLPDGSPSVPEVEITPDFNYTDQGVTFSSPFPVLAIGYPVCPEDGLPLQAAHENSSARNWIIADLVTPAWAVGIFFPGHTTLFAYDDQQVLIASAYGGGSGEGFFLGMVSDVLIATAVEDRGQSGDVLESFLFVPIPEPATFAVLGFGAVALVRRRS